MKVKTLVLGKMSTNCYILTEEKSGVSAVVDPGEFSLELEKAVENLHVEYILITHGHFDHIMGVKKLKEKTGAKIVIGIGDSECLNGDMHNLCAQVGCSLDKCNADITVNDSDTFKIGEENVKVLHTPGHSVGSVCYLLEDSRIMMSGDTLFCLTCGRTDMLGGNSEDMLNSLIRLKNLEGDYAVYPGHNRKTTLSEERVRNRYMKRDLNKWYW